MLPVQEIVISPDEGVIGTGLQFTFPKGMGQNQLGGIKAVVGVVERADVAIAFGLAFFFSLLVIITFSVYQVGVEVYVELLYAALIVGIQLVPVGLLQVLGGMYGYDRPILHLPGRYMPNGHCCDNRGYDETHRRHRGCVGG